MLKKILATTAILAATSGSAFAYGVPYVGAGLGITANTADNDNVGSFRGMPVNVFAGFGGVIQDSFYLAGELGATLATAEISENDSGVKTTYGYGASIIPGIVLSDQTLAFARVGAVQSRFSGSNENSTGGQFGLGMQTNVTQNIDIRGEYDFTAYKSVNESGRSISPRSDAFNLGLIYKFG